MPFTPDEGFADIPEVADLFNSVKVMREAEKAAQSYVDRVKASQDVQLKLAALIDKVKAQIAS